jgi:hypothetical protein
MEEPLSGWNMAVESVSWGAVGQPQDEKLQWYRGSPLPSASLLPFPRSLCTLSIRYLEGEAQPPGKPKGPKGAKASLSRVHTADMVSEPKQAHMRPHVVRLPVSKYANVRGFMRGRVKIMQEMFLNPQHASQLLQASWLSPNELLNITHILRTLKVTRRGRTSAMLQHIRSCSRTCFC